MVWVLRETNSKIYHLKKLRPKGNTDLDRIGEFWTNRVLEKALECFWTNRVLGKFVLFGPFYKMKSKPVLPLKL